VPNVKYVAYVHTQSRTHAHTHTELTLPELKFIISTFNNKLLEKFSTNGGKLNLIEADGWFHIITSVDGQKSGLVKESFFFFVSPPPFPRPRFR